MLPLFQFFLTCFFRSRRMLWMSLLGAIPVFTTLLLFSLKWIGLLQDFSISGLFLRLAFSMFLHFLLPLMAVFMGTSVIIDEVESATLPFLLVRPIPRWQILLSKMLASEILLSTILTGSLFVMYGLMRLEPGAGTICQAGTLLQAALVLILGSFAYVSLFSLVGGLIRKPVLTGLLFTFGWEKIVGSLPGSLRFVTVIYYLNSLFPYQEQATKANLFSLLHAASTTMPAWKAVIIALIFTGIFHFLAMSLLSWKEYVHEDE